MRKFNSNCEVGFKFKSVHNKILSKFQVLNLIPSVFNEVSNNIFF